MNHCLIFDIGKTNKKAFVFNEDYRIVFEKTAVLPETVDDDGDPCEDISLLKRWVLENASELSSDPRFNIRAVNCTAYGASFVHLDADSQPVAPLYHYLKPFPEDLREWFFKKYGGAEKLSLETASPQLGHLNSGLQLLWLKHCKPEVFKKIKYSLHLPQWAASLTGAPFSSEMTSIGCHTMLWNFQKNGYHEWVKREGLTAKFPPFERSQSSARSPQAAIAGTGLHDSSAALIPYLTSFREPFLLISTGTWCISLNPFNDEPLTAAELARDCLCYLTPAGRAVKAARYFGGNEHETTVKKLAEEHGVPPDFYKNQAPTGKAAEVQRFQNAWEGYAEFMRQLMEKQAASARLAIGGSPIRRIYVDGGFSKNEWYMSLLARRFPGLEVFAAQVAQATALGAALAVHQFWNGQTVPANLIDCAKTPDA